MRATSDGDVAELLTRCPGVTVLLEFWPAGLERAGYAAGRLLARLAELSLRLYEVDEVSWAVRRADPAGLLERYPPSGEGFTNLLAVKAPLPPLRGE